jgi:hypothetical protein
MVNVWRRHNPFKISNLYLAKWQERRKELKQKGINRMKEKQLEKLK